MADRIFGMDEASGDFYQELAEAGQDLLGFLETCGVTPDDLKLLTTSLRSFVEANDNHRIEQAAISAQGWMFFIHRMMIRSVIAESGDDDDGVAFKQHLIAEESKRTFATGILFEKLYKLKVDHRDLSDLAEMLALAVTPVTIMVFENGGIVGRRFEWPNLKRTK